MRSGLAPVRVSARSAPPGPGVNGMEPAVSSRVRAAWSAARTISPLAASRSAIAPAATIFPALMTIRWSAVACTSASRWLESSTVPPRSAKSRRNERIQAMPCGSRPVAGSSRISTLGLPMRACASPSRWRMPSE